ncbi:MAG: D-serine ammonia-lyase [Solidesulfovibrio sp. DCME]|uniref:D-serine ammonia-lyase n=1 Tax=Solidesulfovibrio sp. DCME TaxID=3447380 RepID=UPI003D11E56F
MDAALEEALRAEIPVFWPNPGRLSLEAARPGLSVGLADMRSASDRLDRFAPLLAGLFPQELAQAGGIVESDLVPLGPWAANGLPAGDTVWLKADHTLPVAGSVKARGGFHAVLHLAETLALEAGLLDGPAGAVTALATPEARAFFAGQTLSVGSTGNLGLSIGIMGRALGFAVTVHMSAEAKAWKKARLRAVGATVVEHAGDYAAACAVARREAAVSRTIHFIDDENSLDLFLGYAVAGLRLPGQLAARGIAVSPEAPLCLYLPCGVGGAPGGIALGARLALGDAALAFFVEPARAPCMLYGLATGRHDGAHIVELGLNGRTLADGLAVPRPSRLVGRLMEGVCDGVLTVAEADLPRLVARAWREAGLRLEPSAAAALAGPARVRGAGLPALAGQPACHIVWATGGGSLPDDDFAAVLALAGEGA